MRGQAHHRSAVFIFALTALIALGTAPVAGTAPQPVIPTGEAPQGSSDGSDTQESSCPGGSSAVAASGVLLASSSIGSGQRTTYPGPVIPVGPVSPSGEATPASTDCIAELSLSLVVKSPNERKPEGADASLDELAVPRAALESGFNVSLPARSRTISLSKPGQDWELVGTSCSCAGSGVAGAVGVQLASSGIGRGRFATYPSPVIPVGPAGGGCSGPSGPAPAMAAPTIATSATAGMAPIGGGIGQTPRTTYPGPVLPVDPGAPQGPPARSPAQVSWGSDGTVSINDPDGTGGSFSCIWTVELVNGRFTVKTITKPSGAESRFKYRVTPTGLNALKASPTTMSGASDEESLRSGPWSVELIDFDDAWKVKRSSCTESDGTTPSVAAGSSASIGVDVDDRVVCTFELELLTPREGRWRSRNGAGRVVCDGLTIGMEPVTDVGSIKHRRGGDRLVARGLSSGSSGSVTLDRDQNDPRRYTGSKTFTMQGVTARFKVTLDVITEERATGMVTAKARVQGKQCKIRRPFEITFLGGG